CATRSSIFAKSSMVILPSAPTPAPAGLFRGAEPCEAAGDDDFGVSDEGAAWVAIWPDCCSPLAAESVAVAGLCCSSICCILTIVLLSARGNTGSTLPSFVPSGSCPHLRSESDNWVISPSPSCVQILAVACGITGCASAVTILSASADVYKT